MIVCTWNLAVHDVNGYPAKISFDLVDGRAPIIIGTDIKRYAGG